MKKIMLLVLALFLWSDPGWSQVLENLPGMPEHSRNMLRSFREAEERSEDRSFQRRQLELMQEQNQILQQQQRQQLHGPGAFQPLCPPTYGPLR